MGFFSGLNGMACNQALKTLNAHKRNRSVASNDLLIAVKYLANARRLYRVDGYYEGCSENNIIRFFWETGGHLENILGDDDCLPTSPKCNRIYERVRPSECNDIDFYID